MGRRKIERTPAEEEEIKKARRDKRNELRRQRRVMTNNTLHEHGEHNLITSNNLCSLNITDTLLNVNENSSIHNVFDMPSISTNSIPSLSTLSQDRNFEHNYSKTVPIRPTVS